MEHIGERLVAHYWPFTDAPIPGGGINVLTVFNTVVAMLLLWGLLWLAVRQLRLVPGRAQMVAELYFKTFDGLVTSSLELETRAKNRRFLPLISALFGYLLLCNFMGFIPTHYFEEPTADINCTLGLGILALVIAVYCGVRTKGAWGFTEELLGPMWSQPEAKGGAVIAGKLSSLFFFPLNVIGELAKIVSISFRLFGNIIGGAIIITVVSHLTYAFLMPIGLDLFFVFFVGTIQAFVFTMLALTYTAVAIK